MKRDMDLIRQILIHIEELPQAALQNVPDFEGYTTARVIEHVRLLIDAGLITAIDASTLSGPDYINIKMTWHGHEFINTIRDPEIWKKTKAGASKVGGWTVGLLAEIATGYIKLKAAELGLPIG